MKEELAPPRLGGQEWAGLRTLCCHCFRRSLVVTEEKPKRRVAMTHIPREPQGDRKGEQETLREETEVGDGIRDRRVQV